MQTQRVIWAAVAVSTVLYAFIAFTIARNPSGSFDSAFRSPIVIAVYVMALGTFVLGLVYTSIVRPMPDRLGMIVGLALYESCAVFGVIAATVVHDWRLYLAPWALALIGFVRVFPSAEPS